eukprot:scaffold3747_cov258-Ochromonas_danica.AAC.9
MMLTMLMQEVATKHVYTSHLDEKKKVELAGVGVRLKQFGPIKAKVYSAALYLDKAVAVSKLKKLKLLDSKKLFSAPEFEETLVQGDLNKAVLLKMARDVGADTMVNALAESVKPRMEGDLSPLKKFEEVLSNGLKGGKAKNGMVFRFDAKTHEKLDISIDGVKSGTISSPSLVKAFFGVYLDKNAVSPPLKQSVANQISSWLQQ